MTTDAEGVSGPEPARLSVGVVALVGAAVGAALVAVVALWSGQGAEIFLAQAFAALAACF